MSKGSTNSQPQLQLTLGPAILPDFVTGAQFNAILAWPTNGDLCRYHRGADQLTSEALRQTELHSPSEAEAILASWQQIDWARIMASRANAPTFGYLRKRLIQRMAAAHMAIGIMHEDLFGISAELPHGVTALSIDQLCRKIPEQVTISDLGNRENHVWRKSLPIIHLAMATRLLWVGKNGNQSEFHPDLQDVDFYREAVLLAERIEPAVAAHRRIAITGEQMTLVRWLE